MEASYSSSQDQVPPAEPFEGGECSNGDHRAAVEPHRIFIGHTVMQKPMLENSERNLVLFYVHNSQGESKLAIVGRDLGSSRYEYESQDLGSDIPILKCTDKQNVMNWLRELGAGEQVEGPESIMSMESLTSWGGSKTNRGSKLRKRQLEESQVPESSKVRKKMSNICLSSDGFRNGAVVNNGNRNHGCSTNIQHLVQWIEKDAAQEDIDKFRAFAEKLDRTIMYDCDTSDPMCTTRKGIIRILRSLEHYPICLALLEASPLPKQLARLSHHENERISEFANRIRSNWQSTANNALVVAQELSKAGR